MAAYYVLFRLIFFIIRYFKRKQLRSSRRTGLNKNPPRKDGDIEEADFEVLDD